MRDCKEWMGSRREYHDRPRTASSQVLREVITREVYSAPDIVVLNRRYSSMNTSLKEMFQREELTGATYSRLKIILRGEYEKRREVLFEREHRARSEGGTK